MPRMISEKNSPNRSGRITPTVSVLRRVRLRAPLWGTKFNFLTAAIPAARVGAVTLPSPLIARDAVPTDNPASRAASLNVAQHVAPFPSYVAWTTLRLPCAFAGRGNGDTLTGGPKPD